MLEFILHYDYYLFELINGKSSSPFLDLWLIPWRNSLFWIPLYVFLISFFIFNFKSRAYQILLFLMLTVGTSDIVSSHLIKKTVQRQRPCRSELPVEVQARVRCGYGYSFTSSHATNHSSIAAFLFIVFGTVFGMWKWFFPFWAISIGIAQVYVGVHFPSDVISGWIVGAVIGLIWASIFLKYFDLSVHSN